MGQTSSRHHESPTRPTSPTSTPSTTTHAVAGASSDRHSHSSVDADLSTSDSSGSRRSSLRKSILKYVKPSSVRNRLGNVVSNHPKEASRRSSRQCSKAPLEPPALPADTDLASSSNILGDNSQDIAPSDKGKQREMVSPTDDGEALTAESSADADQALQSLETVCLPTQNATDSVVAIGNSHAIDDAPGPSTLTDRSSGDAQSPNVSEVASPLPTINSVHLPDSNENPSEAAPHSFSGPQQSDDSTTRPFPPPGTLVVVQGIVHTTDVSRNGNSPSGSQPPQENASNSSTPAGLESSSEQSRSRARNRLSALLRPRSTSSRPRPASVNESMLAVTEAGLPEAESASSSSSTLSPQISSADGGPHANDLLEASNAAQGSGVNLTSATDTRPPSISSSSIDVLGTLLSVAAAATAASLLTGSSEPILSSGLAPPGSNSPIPSASPLSSPSTSASLSDLPPYPSPSHTGVPDLSTAGRAERLRQAWSTIRERLGLRPSVPPLDAEGVIGPSLDANASGSSSSLANNDSIASGNPTDTRELMLAEMARAFNIGLGLNGLSNLAPNVGATGHTGPQGGISSTQDDPVNSPSGSEGGQSSPGNANATMPPEGSFERFLVDLQVDLRAALTQGEPEADDSRDHQIASQNPLSLPLSTGSTPQVPEDVIPPPTGDLSSSEDRQGDSDVSIPTVEDALADMPPLQEVSDSESEVSEDDHETTFDGDDRHSSITPGPSTSSEGQSQTLPLAPGHIDASGRINWWRLYRFPAVPPPRAGSRPQAGAPLAPFSTPGSPSAEADSRSSLDRPDALFPDFSNSDPAALPSLSQSSPSEEQTGPTPVSQVPTNSVVPVIVVGLQSVNQEWRHDMPPHTGTANEGLEFVGHPQSEGIVGGIGNEAPELDDWEGAGGLHAGPSGGAMSGDGQRPPRRGRNWHSRAANALRNLRSGRRHTEAGHGAHVPLAAPGSRTFFIYVIGGYYPPDHSIVTGGPNILDSFEALLELADLLGQVKPPTVSKEDIEKSGLKIVKASELGQLEKGGEVASNCLDRCLICLDDYDAEDPIRIMSCRHAFHKGCVDEWLEKGRNNCPACRSTGVPTDSHSTSSMPAQAL